MIEEKESYHYSHLFIKEPVWAIVLMAFILLLGSRALFQLQVRKFPQVEQGVITVRSTYAGAPSHLMQSSVTAPLSRAIAQADGIDFIESESRDSFCEVKAFLKVNASLDKAFTDILSQVQSAKKELPPDINDPELFKGTGNSIALLYVAYTADDLNPSLVYNYLDNVIRPQLAIIPGVGQISILGAQPPAMRLWLDFDNMQRYGLDIAAVNRALSEENFLIPSGGFETDLTSASLILESQGRSVQDFEKIIVREQGGLRVLLGDIARCEFGATNYDTEVLFNDKKGVFLSVDMLPVANALTVIRDVREYLDKLEPILPIGLEQEVVYDATTFIYESIVEVVKTTVEASLIVLVIMYLFLRSVRPVFISILAIPLSLLGVAVLMQIAGFSINLLTLLAMILAIGLVIDDAIIVVENCSRYLEKGDLPLEAAKKSIAQIARPIIAMTLTLAVAYSPMIFLDGLVGSLFREFAFTLAGSVLVSGVVALAITPVMCAYLLPAGVHQSPTWLQEISLGYQERLKLFLARPRSVVAFCGVIFVSNILLYGMLSSDLAPKEDQGFALVFYQAPLSNNSTLLRQKSEQIQKVFDSFEEKQDTFLINGIGSPQDGFGGFVAKPIEQRKRSMEDLEIPFREKFSDIQDLKVFSTTPNSLPGVDGLPFQVVLYAPKDYEKLYSRAQDLQASLLDSGYFIFLTTNVEMNKPQYHLSFHETKIRQANLNPQELGFSLLQSLTDNTSGQFNWFGQQFDIIVKAQQRAPQDILEGLPLFDSHGQVLDLSQLVELEMKVGPNIRYQYNQLNAIVLQGMYFPIFTKSDVVAALDSSIQQLNAEGYFVDYLGQTRTYLQEGGQLFLTFSFALIVIYLVLSAQFRSFIDPLIILLTVPLALSGTLFVMNISWLFSMLEGYRHWDVNLNIYTQLGLLTLIGLITKHGVLIVEFANAQLRRGFNSHDAALQAGNERFRPIVMTTATMVAGVLPLLFASGPGAVSRLHLAVVIISGLSIGTLFTLFIIPVIYAQIKGISMKEKNGTSIQKRT